MSLESDLSRLIRDQFDKNGISYNRSMRLDRLTARYFEMTTRQIQPVPRQVHFSHQIQSSLGELSGEGESDSSARDAREAVLRLGQHLVDVRPHPLTRLRQLSVNYVDFHFFPRPK